MITGTISDLRDYRARLAKMIDTSAALRELGHDELADRLLDPMHRLAQSEFGVLARCLLCMKVEPLAVKVGDPGKAEPSAFICAPCSLRIDRAVAAADAAERAANATYIGPGSVA